MHQPPWSFGFLWFLGEASACCLEEAPGSALVVTSFAGHGLQIITGPSPGLRTERIKSQFALICSVEQSVTCLISSRSAQQPSRSAMHLTAAILSQQLCLTNSFHHTLARTPLPGPEDVGDGHGARQQVQEDISGGHGARQQVQCVEPLLVMVCKLTSMGHNAPVMHAYQQSRTIVMNH